MKVDAVIEHCHAATMASGGLGEVRDALVALAEGRIVESLLGVRMPRRPTYRDRETPFWQRVVEMLKDPRTWSTLLYLLLMLPLGVFYFTFAVVGIVVSVVTFLAPLLMLLYHAGMVQIDGDVIVESPHAALLPLISILGILLLTITMHLARGLGHLHGQLARTLLVQAREPA